MASVDHHNERVRKSAQAFAKVAGRDWTYYVTDVSVRIGRPKQSQSGAPERIGTDGGHTSPKSPLQDLSVHIDLGPDMQVSRMHAEIHFHAETGRWYIMVNGRNGLHLDNQRLERGQQAWLQSGNVISILGTQMMFVLPIGAPVINTDIRKQLLGEDEEMSEGGTKDEKQPPPASGGRGRGRGVSNLQSSSTQLPPHRTYATNQDEPEYIQPGTPLTKKEIPQPRSKPSPSYNRGVMMESTEEIDYAADSAKDIKPPHSYAAMIGQAIMSTHEQNATLARIYEYIKENYAFFRHTNGGWQNSIRHNLSLSKCFEKIPRRTDEPGKGMKWQIVPEYRDEFLKKNIQSSRRVRHIGSSEPNTPAHPGAANSGPTMQTERLMGVIGQGADSSRGMKRSRSITPQYGRPDPSYTPDRNQQPSFITGPLPIINANATPPSTNDQLTPDYARAESRFHGMHGLHAPPPVPEGLRFLGTNSPPTLTTLQFDSASAYGSNLFTPLVARTKPNILQQSTSKAPSFYAKELFSSPAPFWKYVDIGSTPVRLPEMSPSKPVGDEDEASPVKGDDGDDVDDKPTLAQPSSPPVFPAPVEDDEEVTSPTRTLSRPASRSNAISMLPQADMKVDQMQEDGPIDADATPSRPPTSASSVPKLGPHSPTETSAYGPLPSVLGLANGNQNGTLGGRKGRGLAFARMDLEDSDEDSLVDLTK